IVLEAAPHAVHEIVELAVGLPAHDDPVATLFGDIERSRLADRGELDGDAVLAGNELPFLRNLDASLAIHQLCGAAKVGPALVALETNEFHGRAGISGMRLHEGLRAGRTQLAGREHSVAVERSGRLAVDSDPRLAEGRRINAPSIGTVLLIDADRAHA